MDDNQVLLAEMTWEEIRKATGPDTVVILPVGATEQHGPHLVVKTDYTLVAEIAERAARQASQEIRVLVAPVLPFGCSAFHDGFPGTPSVGRRTYIELIKELGESILNTGFERLLILNGHGGNSSALQLAAEELYDSTGAAIAVVSYWALAAAEIAELRESAPGGICHACELETSCMLALEPSAVRQDKVKKAIPKWKDDGVLCDLVAATPTYPVFRTADVSPTGVIGDPTVASSEKGERFLREIVQRVAAFIVDLAHWDVKQVHTF
jgi:creatinine amidohydrolase